VLRVALQGLRGRKGPFAGAFVALTVAAALVMACGMLLQAGLSSKPPVERYSGTPVLVTGHQIATTGVGTENVDHVALYERARLSSSLVPRVAALPGVERAIGDVSVPATLRSRGAIVEGPTGHPTALHPWDTAALTPYELSAGSAPAGPDDVVVDSGMARRGRLHPGDRVRLASNGPARSMTVTGIATTPAKVERQGVIFVSSATAARYAALPGRVDAIGVLPDRGTDVGALAARVRDELGHEAEVVTGSARGDSEHIENAEARDAVSAIGSTFGGIALVIAMFVVASTIGLSVLQRQREVALLRAVAATPKQVRRMIRWETLVVALAASAAGIVPGALLAGWLGGALSERGIAPEDMQVAVGAIPVLAAVASTVLTALIAVAAAGRRAARVRPTQALQDSASEPRLIGPVRVGLGLLAVAGAFGLLGAAVTSGDSASAADLAAITSFVLVVAVALLGPLVARVAASILALVLGRTRNVSGFLAVSNMRTASRRFSSAMTPIVLTVAISSTLVFVATTREHETARQERSRVTADLVIQSDGAGIPRSALADVRRTPGVAMAVGTAETSLGPSLGSIYSLAQAQVADPEGLGRVLDLDVNAGSLAKLGAGSIALSQTQADSANAQAGDRVDLVLGDGTHRRVLVAAVYKHGLGFGDAVLPTALAAGHVTNPMLSQILVRTAAGATPAQVASRLGRLTASYPDITVNDRSHHAARVDANRESNNWLFRILSVIIFAFTAIAVVNTLVMIALHRTRELALLRLVGGTRSQVLAMARWEGGMVVGLGVGLGVLIALTTLIPTSHVLSGSYVPYAPIGLVVLVLGASALVGLVATQFSTRLALRPRPVDGIGLRD
jgi:putative ABC transport system permease protein